MEPSEMNDYLMDGILHGFPIVDKDAEIAEYDCKNCSSSTSGAASEFISKLIQQEITENKLIVASRHPRCIHAIGAVPKANNKFRPITDCKRPIGVSVNNFMKTTWQEFSFKSVDDVTSVVQQCDYLATVDITNAYRSVAIRPEHRTYMGLRWNIDGVDTVLNDTRLCFGHKCAPFIFSSLTNFVVQCMNRRGYNRIFCYLDDFIVIEESFQLCQKVQMALISLLGELGFYVNWEKCTSSAQVCTYLGVEIDTKNMKLSLLGKKMQKLHNELTFFQGKRKASKKQIQRLVGVLAHCAKVIKGARLFSRRVIDLLRGLPDRNVRITLSRGFVSDLTWWRKYSHTFNGVTCIIQEEGPHLYSDASKTGYSVTHGSDWVAGFFNSAEVPSDIYLSDPYHMHWINIAIDQSHRENINVLEIIPILLAVNRFGHAWRDKAVTWYSDNSQVVYSVNKGSSTNDYCMEVLRYIFWSSVVHNFHLKCKHISGSDNVIPNTLSRIGFKGTVFDKNLPICCSRASKTG